MKNILNLTVILMLLSILGTSCKEPVEKINKAEKDKTTLTQKGPLSAQEKEHYINLGNKMAKATFEVMSTNLKEALAKGGVQEAVSYCNVVALKLTDSLATEHNASIKRTSLKLRSLDNMPTEDEKTILARFEENFAKDMEMGPIAELVGEDSIHFYKAIKTMPLCLTCHGTKGQELTVTDHDFILGLYPDDKAFGYKENEFRGLWSIKMERNWAGE